MPLFRRRALLSGVRLRAHSHGPPIQQLIPCAMACVVSNLLVRPSPASPLFPSLCSSQPHATTRRSRVHLLRLNIFTNSLGTPRLRFMLVAVRRRTALVVCRASQDSRQSFAQVRAHRLIQISICIQSRPPGSSAVPSFMKRLPSTAHLARIFRYPADRRTHGLLINSAGCSPRLDGTHPGCWHEHGPGPSTG